MRDAALHLVNVPDDIRAAVIDAARDADMSVNDVVGGILAAHYGLGWEQSGHSFTASDSTQWFLRMPSVLKHTIAAHAEAVGGKQTGVVLLVLANHYGLPAPAPGVRRQPTSERLAHDVLVEIQGRVNAGESIRRLEREYGLPRMTLNRALRRLEATGG